MQPPTAPPPRARSYYYFYIICESCNLIKLPREAHNRAMNFENGSKHIEVNYAISCIVSALYIMPMHNYYNRTPAEAAVQINIIDIDMDKSNTSHLSHSAKNLDTYVQ